MFIRLKKPLSIKDIKLENYHLSKIERKDVPMLLIDDEHGDFKILETLHNHNFNILTVPDVTSIEQVKPYEIILCDIKGIGKVFGSEYEGAHVIAEIRKRFPFKTILAYSAFNHDPDYNKYLKVADDVIKKDTDIDLWVEILDNSIEEAKNPEKKWIKLRNFLIEKDVSLFDISLLEDEYTKVFNEGGNLDDFPSKKNQKGLSPDVRAILQSFTASIIFQLVFGK